jgi:hypothetical protein
VADVGDVDGDGLDDIGSGAPSSTYVVPEAGYAYVLSGADGSVLLQWHGDSKKYRTSYGGTTYLGNNFGTRIGGAGDIDGDGRADVWVATEHGLPRPAFIAVYSGATGAMLRKFESTDVQVAAAALGDLTSDGIPEFGAGGQLFSGSSWRDAVLLFDGSDGKELWRGERPDGNANWGGALAATEDVNQDGLRDFAVGASMDDTNAFNTGRVDLLAANDLWLDVQPTHFPTAKDLLTVSAAEGPTGNLVALFLTDVNGTPIFALLGLTTFGAAGQAQWSGKIPSGYAGNTFALQSFAVGRRGRLVSSTAETIAIQ